MPSFQENPQSNIFVNYTTITTSVPDSLSNFSQTQAPDSLAFLIKNNILLSYNLIPKEEEKQEEGKLQEIISSYL